MCCAGCDASFLVLALTATWVALTLFRQVPFVPKPAQTIARWTSYAFGLLVLTTAIFLGVLERDDTLRNYVFSRIMTFIAKGEEMTKTRCALLENVKGHVLEVGTGPGTNFRCWGHPDNTASPSTAAHISAGSILSYVGLEPNENFANDIDEEKAKWNLSFPVTMTYESGESALARLPDASIDAVVSTHLLCSVGENFIIDSMLRQVSRILKPGGKFFFLEHVSAEQGTIAHVMQRVLSPLLKVIGNGCEFKPTGEILEEWEKNNKSRMRLEMTRWLAPMPIPFFQPHVSGSLRKVDV